MSDKITVLIPTSPIPSHPDTGIIEDVIASVRRQLPDSKVVLMCDGVRPAVEHRRAQYAEYRSRLLAKCGRGEWSNVEGMVFSEPTQQAGMTRVALKSVLTPYVLFMEHDGVLIDQPINWQAITGTIEEGEANMVRLYWREVIHPEHEYLMHGLYESHGAQFVRTTQYSQWPNVASKAFYEKMLADHFVIGHRDMIETVMYGPVANAPWNVYKVVIYYPQPDATAWNHRNGRQGDPADW